MDDDLRTYDYSHPKLVADLVMKGGITSGIVYPHAACELAKTYRFKSVGGTSAGAIAAALIAAAEVGRQKGGFNKLAGVPEWLGCGSHLVRTFQPQKGTHRLFAVAAKGSGAKYKAPAITAAALRRFPAGAALGAIPGIFLTALGASRGRRGVLAGPVGTAGVASAGAFTITVGAAFGIGLEAAAAAVRNLPRNFFGLCTGMEGEGSERQDPLTVWLSRRINDFAGLPPDGPPLTFGHIDKAHMRLRMVTTSLSHGRPYRLPFRKNVAPFYFDPKEMRAFFPESVVQWMEDHPSPLAPPLPGPLRPLPDTANLPVVVATRLSLSFPGLISAVPLWSTDLHTGDANAGRAEKCWFSDGGIVSNFPLHFFDGPLPNHPTFAINLRRRDAERIDDRDRENVWLAPPCDSTAGADWYRWKARGPGALTGFVRSIFQTMQNWNDNSQMGIPGYGDRIAHVTHSKAEGGMNLAMDRDTVLALARRGECAGRKLTERFDPEPPAEGWWNSHRWLRFRSAIGVMERHCCKFAEGYEKPPSGAALTYEQLLDRNPDEPPLVYPWRNGQHKLAIDTVHELLRVIEDWRTNEEKLAEGGPQPHPQLRVMPHW